MAGLNPLERSAAGGALRLLVFDRTCRWPRPPLTRAWRAGRWLYTRLGRLDLALGAASWEEALDWLAEVRPGARIEEIQIWSHGRWGRALLEQSALCREALVPGHPLESRLRALRARLAGEHSLLWFRTCETIGARAGQDFARALADWLGCRVAGHTHIIGFWQSGLHSLRPGQAPAWSAAEGLEAGTADEPVRARRSSPGAPHTITCLHGRIPDGF